MDQSSSSWETIMDVTNQTQSSSWETMNSSEEQPSNQESIMDVTNQDSFSDESNYSSTGYIADNEDTNEFMRHNEVSKRLTDFLHKLFHI